MNTKELRRQRAALVAQAREIVNSLPEGQSLAGEQLQQYERIMADVDTLKANIDRMEQLSSLEAEMSNPISREQRPSQVQEVALTGTPEYRAAFMANLRGGSGACTPEQIDLLRQTRAQSLTGSEGGYTVPQGFVDRVLSAMKAVGTVQSAGATVIQTATGQDLPMATNNDTGNSGELLAENTGAASQDLAFGQIVLKAFKFSSKTLLVSYELLQDTGVDLEGYIAEKLGQRIGRVVNNYFTVGDGTGEPQGVVTGSTVGKVGGTGQQTSVIVDDLIDLEHSVDPAYRYNGKARWMFHDSTLKAIKKLLDQNEVPLWQPGLALREPDTILGYPYVVNQNMPVMAADAKSILFGDFSTYMIRVAKDIQLYRIVDKYIESAQVGFVAFYRADGRCGDAGTHPICHYKNTAAA